MIETKISTLVETTNLKPRDKPTDSKWNLLTSLNPQMDRDHAWKVLLLNVLVPGSGTFYGSLR